MKEKKLFQIPNDWDVNTLDFYCKIIDPHPSHRAPKEVPNGYPFVGIKDINNKGEILNDARKVSLEDVLAQNETFKLEENDIGFGRVGTIGKVVWLKKKSFPYAISPTMAIIKAKKSNPIYTYYFLSSNQTFKQFRLISTGSTRTSIGMKNLRKLSFIAPPLPEQQKIASILSTVDEKIENTDRQIEQAQNLKKGLMQRLLTRGIGHTRFKSSPLGEIPESWEVNTVKSIGEIVTGGTPSTKKREYYSDDIDDGYLWATPIDLGYSKFIKNTNTKLTYLGLKETRIIPKESIMVTCIGSTIGKVGMAPQKMATNQQINSVICNMYNNPHFFYYYFQQIRELIKSLAGVQAVPIINKTTFSNLQIPIPPLQEQQKIASILSTVDEKLENLQSKKSQYEQFKKGLMQKMLTGKIRVKVN